MHRYLSAGGYVACGYVAYRAPKRNVSEWGVVFGDAVVATAILDRLLHHSHVITIRGESYRLKEKRRAGVLLQQHPCANPSSIHQTA